MAADFVNTKGWIGGSERLGGTDEVRAFLVAHGEDKRVTKADIPKLHTLRDRVRAVFTAANDGLARRQINALLADFPTRPRLANDGEHDVTFEPGGNDAVSWIGANAALGLAFFVAEHGTTRLGICGASDCDDAYVDGSKNSTKHCCSPKCTRLENVRAFRARQHAKRAGSNNLQ